MALVAASVVGIGALSTVTPETGSGITASVEQAKTIKNEVPTEQSLVDFNFGWTFKKGDLLSQRPYESYFDDSSWKNVNLPYDWSVYEDFDPDISSEIGHLPGGQGWYRKQFAVPESLKGKRITINFDGVYMESTIYVNGKKVGFYPSGYAPFYFDITDYLFYGDTLNTIAVSVRNIDGSDGNGASSRWYSGSGIYRDVYLTIQNSVSIAQDGTDITFPDLKTNYTANQENFTAKARVTSTVFNSSAAPSTITVRNTLLDYKTQAPSSIAQPVVSAEVEVAAGAKVDVVNDLVASNPKLWSTEDPNLYTVKTEVIAADGTVLDTQYDRIGFRFFDWYTMKDVQDGEGPAEGFFLNGVLTKFNGVCMHHDQGSLGANSYYDAVYRQMTTMKAMGVNAIRITHNPASSELLQICDELGLLTIEEFFDSWYSAKASQDFHRFFEVESTHPDAQKGETWAQFDLQSTIRKHKNYPSIVMWSVGNEIWDTHHFSSSAAKEKGLRTIKNLVKWAHEADVDNEDETRASGQRRFVTIGQNQWDKDNLDLMRELDAVGYNYWYIFYNSQGGRGTDVSDIRFYGSETSSAVKSRGYYAQGGAEYASVNNMKGVGDQLSSWDNSSVGWGHTASYSLKQTQESTSDGTNKLLSAGEFVWTGFDYGGEPTPWNQMNDRTPKSSYFGIVDTAGFAKDDYFLYQSQWLDRSNPKNIFAHIVGHYNWEDQTLASQMLNSDGTLPVKVYSNASQVELFVQKPGQEAVSYGKKGFTEKTKTNGKVTETYYRATDDANHLYLQWNIPWEYEVGTKVFVKAYDEKGEEIALPEYDPFERNAAQSEVVTAGKPEKIVLTAETDTMTADSYGLIYVDAQVVDSQGNPVPTAQNLIEFSYVGDSQVAEIAGVDNGEASSWERYKDYDGEWRRSLFNGKALAIVKSNGGEGMFSLVARSAGLQSAHVTLFASADYSTSSAALDPQVYADVDGMRRIAGIDA